MCGWPSARCRFGWWLNDERLISLYNDRQAVIDDGVSRRVTLRKGPNVIRGGHHQCGRPHGLLRALPGCLRTMPVTCLKTRSQWCQRGIVELRHLGTSLLSPRN